jgi:NACHT domain- and WD repeat-containing protein
MMPGDALSFQLFVSSTFRDFRVERDALRLYVFPRLRARCQARGATFEAVDLRWGISASAAEARRTMEICLDEVERCVRSTARPNFLLLLGDRLGWRPLPAWLDDELFARLAQRLRASEAGELLERWYPVRDDNAVPPARLMHVPPEGQSGSERRLVDAIAAVAADMDLDPFTEARLAGGATEQEVRRRLELAPIEDDRAVLVIRTIDGLPGGLQAEDWQDVGADGQLDDASVSRLRSLHADLRARAGKAVLRYTTRWRAEEPDTAYIGQFCAQVHDRLARAIDMEFDDRDVNPSEAREERNHRAFGQTLAGRVSGREEELDRILDWVNRPGGGVLIVHGPSGAGKTSLLAAAALDPRFPGRSVVRFLGATAGSTAPAVLAAGLLSALRPDGTLPLAPAAVAEDLARLLSAWPEADPIVVVIDALDQIGPDGVAAWLSTDLSRSVRLLLSVVDGPDPARLATMLPRAEWLAVPRLPMQDAARALDAWLAGSARTLQPRQRALVLDAFSRSGMPLHLRLLFERARTWNSGYDPVSLPVDTPAALQQLFRDLAAPAANGPVLVQAALTSLVTAREGLSSPELIEILSADPEVMQEFRKRSPDSPDVDALPGVVWIRLLRDLEPYLAERDRRGGTTLGMFHRQVGVAIEHRWLTGSARQRCHHRLAAYFASQRTWLDLDGEQAPNLRKLAELPYQQTMAADWPAVQELLTNPDTLRALVAGLGPWELADDLERASEMAPDGSIPALRDAARAAAPVVAADPRLLPSQLLGRLPETQIAIRARLSAGPWRSAWLEPLTPTLGARDLRFVLRGHAGTVSTLAVSADGRWCATASSSASDRTVRIWSLMTGENVQVLPGMARKEGRTPLAFDHQGYVLVGVGPTVISIAPLSGRRQELLDAGHTIACLAAAAAAPVIAAGTTGRTLHVLDARQSRIVAVGRELVAVAVSPSGRHIAVLGEDGLTAVDSQGTVQAQLVTAVDAPGQVPLAISDDGATVRFGRNLREWRADNGTTADLLDPPWGDVRAVLALSPDGTKALVSPRAEDMRDSYIPPHQDRLVAGWTVGASFPDSAMKDPGSLVSATGLTSDGRTAVAAYLDHDLRVWNLSREPPPTRGQDNPIRNIDIRDDAAYVMDAGNIPSVWNLHTGARDDDRVPTGDELMTWIATDATETPSDPLSVHDQIERWRIAADAPVGICYRPQTQQVSEALDPPDGHSPPTAPFDVWELDTANRPRRRRHTGHSNRLTKIVPTSDGAAAIVAGYGSLRVFDLVSGRQRWRLDGHTRPVWDIDVVDRAGVAVSGSEDSSVRLWDLSHGSQIASFQGESPIRVVRGTVIDDTVIVVAGEISGRIHILRLRDS